MHVSGSDPGRQMIFAMQPSVTNCTYPCLHDTLCLVLVVVRNIGYRVKQASNSMPTIGSHHTAFVGTCNLVNRRSQISVKSSRFHHRQGRRQTFKGCLHKFLSIGIHLSNTKCLIQISMVSTLVVGRDINIHNITVFDFSIIRNSVTNDLVNGSANTLGKIVIIQGRRITSSFYRCFVNDAIDFIRRRTHPTRFSTKIQHFSTHGTCMAQTIFAIQLFGSVHSNRVVIGFILSFRLRNASNVIGVVGFANTRRNQAFGTVQGRSESTGKVVIRGPVGRTQLELASSVERTGNPISGRRFSVLNTSNAKRIDENVSRKTNIAAVPTQPNPTLRRTYNKTYKTTRTLEPQ